MAPARRWSAGGRTGELDLAESSQSLARLTSEQITNQWEPFVTAQIDQTPGAWPRSVTLANFTTGPAIDCVYVGIFEDTQGLGMWTVTKPIDLQGIGERWRSGLKLTALIAWNSM